MSLFAIADLHLSLGTDKPMDIFSGWTDYVKRLENNWKSLVTDEDTVVIAGDISWAMKLEECVADFAFINSLPGKKILLKGNHDYWWATKKKIDAFLELNGFDTISVLVNNAYEVGDFAVCGTRGWFLDASEKEDVKVLNREVGRLTSSIKEAKRFNKEIVAFLHYPPVYGGVECEELLNVLLENGIKKCYYGHLHGANTIKYALNGEYKGIDFRLISCDGVRFTPILVR